ncbi:5-formyltetrahydrofolate cyclo-ligase [Phenylobacterium sp.]|uniref:5-formyltetrahydrofolate cyclo-ligase n=1 Tax=Phenylobacterium sp. TaxID=1871053 RepID=UPI0025F387A9|nr:5-formyltetrahydrofolate cyclo-ligase [Phenylobacterium sp.]MCA6285637.1 5-formyltetrahydrofolate cyclo-ligase [Phenylobacterium sp.]MCA6289584.1 5-formyltetrahydrofolate cyclo-ligase [Phenylobacterium sp.]MCA6310807.1 5-formyltetrahydrofolate cyclo-ligase [Phenylobacterium sp.]MCA6324298.1 5-formyltetrahydrofolate cyclo-ligase [Phenylobacterium sp.]MCA6337785.1 5-formyltetrahydrofolate cyclo-ligase [Phenylobacterium sp.]
MPSNDPHPTSRPDLRRRLRRRRRALAVAAPQAGEAAARLLPPDALPPVRTFAAYLPTGGEIDPGPLSARLLALGVERLLPRAFEDGSLRFLDAPPEAPLAPDAAGVPAPLPDRPERRPDLVIAPLVGFDRFGGRLGQGGGHYDRALERLRRNGPVFVLGLAYAGQEVDRLALEPHDQTLDAVLTEVGYRRLPQA